MIGIKVCMVNRIEKYAVAIARLPVRFTVSLNVLNLCVVFGVLEYCVKASVLEIVP